MRRAFGVSSSPLVSLAAGLNLNEPSSKVGVGSGEADDEFC